MLNTKEAKQLANEKNFKNMRRVKNNLINYFGEDDDDIWAEDTQICEL